MYWHVMFVAVVFIAVEYQQKLFYTFLMGLDYYDKREKIKLGICILSSREHFEEREALRNTWLQLLNSDKYNENSKAVFVIGESCPVSPDNRLDVYSCNKWDMSNLALEDINYLFYCQNQPDEKLYNPLTRISLQVLHSVKVRRIGIYEGLLNIPTLKPLTIILFNGLTEEEIASVKFSKEDKGFLEGGFYYQPIQVLTLPKDFEGEMMIEVTGSNGQSFRHPNMVMNCVMVNTAGVLNIEGMNEDRTYISSNTTFGSLMSLAYSIDNPEKLKEKQKSQQESDLIWEQKQSNIDKRLKRESSVYKDVLRVDIIDVYRNLSSKLLTCHRWFKDNYKTDYIMKTDDDCYVDIETIWSKLQTISTRSKLWWANFRSDWLVERHGKWKEKDYTASVYPKFACGSGNIISSDILDWLIKNKHDFHHFQGEDVSMGIWLSPISVDYVQDNLWICNNTCSKDTVPLVIPELPPPEILTYWRNRQQCGQPCYCDVR